MAVMPGYTEVVEELKKVKGFTVKREGSINMMGSNVKTTNQLVEIAEKKAPPGTYAVPEGYTSEQFQLPRMGGQ